MALSLYNSAILARSECFGFEGKRYANAQVGNGFRTAKPVKIKCHQIQLKNVKIRNEQMEVDSLQPCLVRREALVGFGTSFLTIVLLPSESAEARTVKPDVMKKIREKLDELREKAGLKKKNEDENSSTDSEIIPKPSAELAQKERDLLVEADLYG